MRIKYVEFNDPLKGMHPQVQFIHGRGHQDILSLIKNEFKFKAPPLLYLCDIQLAKVNLNTTDVRVFKNYVITLWVVCLVYSHLLSPVVKNKVPLVDFSKKQGSVNMLFQKPLNRKPLVTHRRRHVRGLKVYNITLG